MTMKLPLALLLIATPAFAQPTEPTPPLVIVSTYVLAHGAEFHVNVGVAFATVPLGAMVAGANVGGVLVVSR